MTARLLLGCCFKLPATKHAHRPEILVVGGCGHRVVFFLFAPTEADFSCSGIGSVRELALLQALRVTSSCVCAVPK